MKIALIDWESGGHHRDYIERYAQVFSSLGAEVCCFFPEHLEFQEDLIEAHVIPPVVYSYSALPLYSLRSIANKWRKAVRVLKKTKQPYDLVFFMSLDQMVYDSPRGWMNKLFAYWIAQAFPWKWTGLLFDLGPVKGKAYQSTIFNAKNCTGIFSLDEYQAKDITNTLGKPCTALPDVTNDVSPNMDWEVIKEIQEKANGRAIVSLLGALQRRKGLLPYLKAIHQNTNEQLFFVLAGKLYKEGFSEEEWKEVNQLIELLPSNAYTYLAHIPDEATFNALVKQSSVIYAAYINFPNSSGLVSKAALYHKPIIVSKGFLMDKKVNQYQTGISIPQENSHEIVRAIEQLSSQNIKESSHENFNAHHDVQILHRVLKNCLGWF